MKINFSLYHTRIKTENRLQMIKHNMSVVPRIDEVIHFGDSSYSVKSVHYNLVKNFIDRDATEIWVFAVRNES